MAAVLAASGLFLYLRLSSHLALALDRELRLRAQDLTALVHDPNASLANDSASRFVERGESYAQLLAPSGGVLDATRPLGRTPVLTPRELEAARRGPIYVDKPSVPGLDEPSRILATGLRRTGRPLVLAVGATVQDRAETLASFRNELLIAGPLALILASTAGYFLAGLSLRSVESMRRRAAAISAATPGERLPVAPTGDELERLGTTLNEMLARLEAAVARERDFVAEAGHELRTPLSLLRTELELALRHTGSVDELKEAVGRSSREVERLAQLAEDLLLIARSDAGRLPLRIETVRVADLFEAVRNRVAWRADVERKRVLVDTTESARVRGDRLRLEQALTNMVDNALRYGGAEIRLETSSADGELRLHVRDDGPGFPDGFREGAFERFARADGARGRGGAGLGLAIVRTIAEAHGGIAEVVSRGGGADVWISLPAAERPVRGAGAESAARRRQRLPDRRSDHVGVLLPENERRANLQHVAVETRPSDQDPAVAQRIDDAPGERRVGLARLGGELDADEEPAAADVCDRSPG
jgi:two-component system OmpR family sensor kinase